MQSRQFGAIVMMQLIGSGFAMHCATAAAHANQLHPCSETPLLPNIRPASRFGP
jgi:hypothetical protein